MGYRYGAQCFDDQHAQAEAWCAGAAGDGVSCNSCWSEGSAYSCEFQNISTGSFIYLNPGWSACELTPFSPAVAAEYFSAGFGSVGLILLAAWGCRQVLAMINPHINK